METIALTIVLNGMPYIEKQCEVLPNIFHQWHVVEGVTLPTHDTSWCKPVDQKFYNSQYLSIDGTTKALNNCAKKHNNVFIYRKNGFWNGKTQMCNVVAPYLQNCILMQFDADEIWSPSVLKQVLSYAHETDIQGMLFKCKYFVGPNLYILNENCYGNYENEWRRLWKINQKTKFVSHEPPQLLGIDNYVSKEFTKQQGWTFDHYAYATESQLQFKQNFYGYANAVQQWKALQANDSFPCKLKDYFSWVKDEAIVVKN